MNGACAETPDRGDEFPSVGARDLGGISGPLNVNGLKAEAIVNGLTALGLSRAVAEAVLAERERLGGSFTSFDNLLAVRGIGRSTLAQMRERLSLGISPLDFPVRTLLVNHGHHTRPAEARAIGSLLIPQVDAALADLEPARTVVLWLEDGYEITSPQEYTRVTHLLHACDEALGYPKGRLLRCILENQEIPAEAGKTLEQEFRRPLKLANQMEAFEQRINRGQALAPGEIPQGFQEPIYDWYILQRRTRSMELHHEVVGLEVIYSAIRQWNHLLEMGKALGQSLGEDALAHMHALLCQETRAILIRDRDLARQIREKHDTDETQAHIPIRGIIHGPSFQAELQSAGLENVSSESAEGSKTLEALADSPQVQFLREGLPGRDSARGRELALRELLSKLAMGVSTEQISRVPYQILESWLEQIVSNDEISPPQEKMRLSREIALGNFDSPWLSPQASTEPKAENPPKRLRLPFFAKLFGRRRT